MERRTRHPCGGVSRLSATRRHFLRRPDRPSRLLPGRAGGASPLARRRWICRAGGAVPVPARTGFEPGRLFVGSPAWQRPARRLRGMGRLHPPVRPDPLRIRAGGRVVHRAARGRNPARPQAGRGRGGGAGDLGHGQDTGTRPNAGRYRPGGDGDRHPAWRIAGPGGRDRPGRGDRTASMPGRGRIGVGTSPLPRVAPRRRGGPDAVRAAVPGAAHPGGYHGAPGGGPVRRLLSLGRARLRWRPCGAAFAPGGSGGCGLGCQRCLPGRLWPGPGGAGALVHVRRLPGRGVRACAERHRRGGDRAGGRIPPRPVAGLWNAALLGRPAGAPCRPGGDARGQCSRRRDPWCRAL